MLTKSNNISQNILYHDQVTFLLCVCLVTQSCPTLCMNWSLSGFSVHGDSPSKSTGVECHALLQGIFPTQGLNPGPHCRGIFYWLCHQGRWKILEWVGYPFYWGTSPPRNQTRVSCIAGSFFTSWATREAHFYPRNKKIIDSRNSFFVNTFIDKLREKNRMSILKNRKINLIVRTYCIAQGTLLNIQ